MKRRRMIRLDPLQNDKHYLGCLCKHGHEYQNTGCSLRYKSNKGCVECRINRANLQHRELKQFKVA